MVISTPRSSYSSDGSLAAALGEAARRAKPPRLALIAIGGLIAGVAIALLWSGHRVASVPFVMPIAFGIWGLAAHGERSLADVADTNVERVLLRVLRVAMAVIGAVAAAVTLFGVTFALAGSGGLQLR
jgi:ABC-type transport system involved in cytochrome c biogenesis permease subunit